MRLSPTNFLLSFSSSLQVGFAPLVFLFCVVWGREGISWFRGKKPPALFKQGAPPGKPRGVSISGPRGGSLWGNHPGPGGNHLQRNSTKAFEIALGEAPVCEGMSWWAGDKEEHYQQRRRQGRRRSETNHDFFLLKGEMWGCLRAGNLLCSFGRPGVGGLGGTSPGGPKPDGVDTKKKPQKNNQRTFSDFTQSFKGFSKGFPKDKRIFGIGRSAKRAIANGDPPVKCSLRHGQKGRLAARSVFKGIIDEKKCIEKKNKIRKKQKKKKQTKTIKKKKKKNKKKTPKKKNKKKKEKKKKQKKNYKKKSK